ncbi:MAG: hypothetical protein ONB23_00695 [candidate division KSB1 bacterium]|nr:hypothetical protein [candidate division KSB1 bacterium]
MARASNRRIYEGWCRRCQGVRKHRLVGWNEEAELAWLRCNACHTTYAIETLRLLPDGRFVDSPDDQTDRPTGPPSEIVEYDPAATYSVGQRIHHPVFQDVGRVIAVDRRGRCGRIVVEFENVGQKVLVEGRALPR